MEVERKLLEPVKSIRVNDRNETGEETMSNIGEKHFIIVIRLFQGSIINEHHPTSVLNGA